MAETPKTTPDDAMRDFYVYAHKDGNGLIFYVGKGRNRRAYENAKRHPAWHEKVEALAGVYQVEFLATGLLEREAYYEEAEWIRKLGKISEGTGPLVNWTDGGESELGNVGISVEVPGLKEAFDRTSVVLIRGKDRAKFIADLDGMLADWRESIERAYSGRKRHMTECQDLLSFISSIEDELYSYGRRRVGTKELAFALDDLIASIEWLDESDFKHHAVGLTLAKEGAAKLLSLRERIGKPRSPPPPLAAKDIPKIEAALVALKELINRGDPKLTCRES